MFTPTTTEKSDLDRLIDDVTSQMLQHPDLTSDEYKLLLEHLTKLESIKKDNRPDRLSADAKAMLAGHFISIALVMNHERAHVITTKAWQLLTKLR